MVLRSLKYDTYALFNMSQRLQMTKTLGRQQTWKCTAHIYSEKHSHSLFSSPKKKSRVVWVGLCQSWHQQVGEYFKRFFYFIIQKFVFLSIISPPPALCGQMWGGESNAFKTLAFSISCGKSTYSVVWSICFKKCRSSHNLACTWLTLVRNVDN